MGNTEGERRVPIVPWVSHPAQEVDWDLSGSNVSDHLIEVGDRLHSDRDTERLPKTLLNCREVSSQEVRSSRTSFDSQRGRTAPPKELLRFCRIISVLPGSRIV